MPGIEFSRRTLPIEGLDTADFAIDFLADPSGDGDSKRDMANVLGSDTKPPRYAAINSPKKCRLSQLWRCRLKTQVQIKPPDCDSEHNAHFHNSSRGFVPPKPKTLVTDSEVARRIRELREERKESQTEFARILGTIPSAISKWEAGKNRPYPNVFARLASIATGESKRFFLAGAGLSVNDSGQIDFGLGAMASQLERAAKAARAHRHSSKDDEAVTWDPDLLKFVIETVDVELKKKGRKLSSRKYGEIVVILYEVCNKTGSRDSAMMGRLLMIA